MTFIEFVGLVLSLAAMIFLVIKRVFEEAQRSRNPEEYARKEKQREENIRRMMKGRGLDRGIREERVPSQKKAVSSLPQPPSIPISKGVPKASVVDFIKPAESYEVARRESISVGSRLISSLKTPREMLIIKEILDKPLSMRDK